MKYLNQLHEWLCSQPSENHLIGFFVYIALASCVIAYYLVKYGIHNRYEYEHKREEKKRKR